LLALLVGSAWACSNDDGLMEGQFVPPVGPAASCYSIENVAQAGERPILAFDRYGKAYFAAQEGGAINYGTDNDGCWATFDAIAHGNLVAFTVTDAGVAQLAYRGGEDGGLFYASAANGFVPQLVDRGPWREAEPTYASIVIDGRGQVDLFYSRADEVRHAFLDNAYWRVETLSLGNGTESGCVPMRRHRNVALRSSNRSAGCEVAGHN
jgi:hypothetical protein